MLIVIEQLLPDAVGALRGLQAALAFFVIGSSPVAAVAELAKRIKIDLVQIEEETALKIVRDHPFFNTSAVLMGAYEHVPLTGTLSIGTIWVTSAAVDEDVVYGITTALWHERNRDLLDQGHPKGKFIDPARALEGIGIPLHPGAERFYREAGLVH